MIRHLKRATLRGFGTLAPRAAAAWAERSFLTPIRAPQLKLAPPVASAERYRIPFDGGRLALTRWGEGPAVLLVHGWGGTSRDLWRLVDTLVAYGFAPVTLDLPAHGKSDGRRTTLIQCAEAVRRVGTAVAPIHAAVAHSLGAPATALAMLKGLRLERLVMVAPPRSLYDTMSKNAREAGLPEHVFLEVTGNVASRLQIDWAELDTDWMAARLDVPLLVVHDEEDRLSPWTHGAAVARAAPRGTLLTTAGLGHRAVLANDHVIAQVAAFVADGRGS